MSSNRLMAWPMLARLKGLGYCIWSISFLSYWFGAATRRPRSLPTRRMSLSKVHYSQLLPMYGSTKHIGKYTSRSSSLPRQRGLSWVCRKLIL